MSNQIGVFTEKDRNIPVFNPKERCSFRTAEEVVSSFFAVSYAAKNLEMGGKNLSKTWESWEVASKNNLSNEVFRVYWQQPFPVCCSTK